MVAGAVLCLAPEFAFSQWCWWSKAGGVLSLAHRSVSHALCSLVNGRGVAEPLTFPNAWTYACYLQSSLSPRDPVLRPSTPPPRLLPRPFSKPIKPNVAFLSSFLHLPVDFFFFYMIVSQTEGSLVTKATGSVACAFSVSPERSAQSAHSLVEGCSDAEGPFESFK